MLCFLSSQSFRSKARRSRSLSLPGPAGDPVRALLSEVVFPVLGDLEFPLDAPEELLVGLLLAAGDLVLDGVVVDVGHHVVHVLLALALDLVDVVGQGVPDVLDCSLLVLLADQFEIPVVGLEHLLRDGAVVLEVALQVVEG